jgi:hypothetical protein
MMQPAEEDTMYGEAHVLTVTAVRAGTAEAGWGAELDYVLGHPAVCKTVPDTSYGPDTGLVQWDCAVAAHEREAGMAVLLAEAGTPVTEPGTYVVRAWARQYRTGGQLQHTEHEAGVGIEPDAVLPGHPCEECERICPGAGEHTHLCGIRGCAGLHLAPEDPGRAYERDRLAALEETAVAYAGLREAAQDVLRASQRLLETRGAGAGARKAALELQGALGMLEAVLGAGKP